MIIISYLTENFIRETLSMDNEELRIFLESLCKRKDFIYFISEPGLNYAKIKKNPPKNYTQSNLSTWGSYISYLIKIGRLREYEFLRKFTLKDDLEEKIYKKEFMKRAIENKVFYLSFKDLKIKKPIFKMKSLGNSLEQIKFNIEGLIQDYEFPTKNIKDLGDRKKLFFEKLGGFCFFNNTFICIDRFILDTAKINPVIYLKTIISQLKGSSIRNLIILASDPYAEYPRKRDEKDNMNKFQCIDNYIKSLERAMYPNNIQIQLFLMVPEELKRFHSRYFSWAELPSYKGPEMKDLTNLEDQIVVALQPDKPGIFEEDSEFGNEAKFNYVTKTEVNNKVKDLINSSPNESYKSYSYWIQQKYPAQRSWIDYEDVLKMERANKS